MDRLDAMRTFLAVADLRSFAGAARQLRLSAPAVTRAVALLEADLATPLLSRTTRSVRLTERGTLYAEGCRRILAEVDQARSRARGENAEPHGRLSITAPVVFGRMHVLPIAETLLDRHAGLSVRLDFVDRVTHLVEEGYDIAVRIGQLADSALAAVPLGRVDRVLVASPAYLAAHGEPAGPADLRRHRIVGFEGIGATSEWRFGGAGPATVTVAPRLAVNSADAAIASALRHQGITRVLSYQVDDALRNGRLRRLLAGHEPPPLPVSALFQASRRGSPNVAAFLRVARERLRGVLSATAAGDGPAA